MSTDIRRPAVTATRIVVLTTVMLTFISFWRAAAVVLNDLASTAYYIGGIAEEAIGKAAPWFILMVMLFSYAVRAVYMESCSMFVRGGVYRIVKEAMGSRLAKVSVSALVFDYVLTGPISAVSAGQYLHGLLNSFSRTVVASDLAVSSEAFAVMFAIAVTAYFWWLNIKGIEESSDKALKIMKVTTVMAVIIIGWSLVTMGIRIWDPSRPVIAFDRNLGPYPVSLPPIVPQLGEHSLGWLHGIPWVKTFGLAVFLVTFGHSILAMSGEETLAQVYREIEAPKHRNLFRAGMVIFVFSLVLTSFVSFAAVILIPDGLRHESRDNLINGLVMCFEGPRLLKLIVQAFVVVVGALILAGAVNTSIIGSNGVLNRVAEDGVLDDWFRQPHRRFGTTHRIINLIALLQIATILISRGRVYMLGEAYAFGVVWSFTFMGIAMLVLRFRYTGERLWKVPFNVTWRGLEIPVGLGVVVLVLILVAVANLFTKQVATISGMSFTGGFYALFAFSEWHTRRKRERLPLHEHREKFIVENRSELTPEDMNLPAGRRRILVPVRDPGNLHHLKCALEESFEHNTEIIVLTIKVEKGDQAFQHLFTEEEQKLFTNVVALAEKYGEKVVPLVVASNNSWFAICRSALELDVNEIWLGKSERISADVQLEQLAINWALAGRRDPAIKFKILAHREEHTASV